jgi:hypothetical protein
MAVATNRYSTSNVEQPKRLICVHTSETGETSLANLLALIEKPGTAIVPGSNPPRTFGSCYHAFADASTEGYVQVLPGSAGPYANGGANKFTWSICIPGRAGQTRDEWLDSVSRRQIKGVARFIVDKGRDDGIPLVKLTPAQMVAGEKGYCGHIDVTNAWHQTNHWDPGPNFPWDVLAQDIAELTTPGDIMTPDRRILWDSRTFGDPIPAGNPIPLPIDGAGSHKACTLTVVVIQPETTGYLTFGEDIPDVPIPQAGVNAANTTTVPLRTIGTGRGVAFSCNTRAHIQISLLAWND